AAETGGGAATRREVTAAPRPEGTRVGDDRTADAGEPSPIGPVPRPPAGTLAARPAGPATAGRPPMEPAAPTATAQPTLPALGADQSARPPVGVAPPTPAGAIQRRTAPAEASPAAAELARPSAAAPGRSGAVPEAADPVGPWVAGDGAVNRRGGLASAPASPSAESSPSAEASTAEPGVPPARPPVQRRTATGQAPVRPATAGCSVVGAPGAPAGDEWSDPDGAATAATSPRGDRGGSATPAAEHPRAIVPGEVDPNTVPPAIPDGPAMPERVGWVTGARRGTGGGGEEAAAAGGLAAPAALAGMGVPSPAAPLAGREGAQPSRPGEQAEGASA